MTDATGYVIPEGYEDEKQVTIAYLRGRGAEVNRPKTIARLCGGEVVRVSPGNPCYREFWAFTQAQLVEEEKLAIAWLTRKIGQDELDELV